MRDKVCISEARVRVIAASLVSVLGGNRVACIKWYAMILMPHFEQPHLRKEMGNSKEHDLVLKPKA